MAAFEKKIPENVVEYQLYPRIAGDCNALQALSVLGAECMHSVNELCKEYIWNNQRFNLSLPEHDVQCPPHLHGATDFGDNVEDEWLIAFVCVELTRRIQGLAIKLEDSDGQFLLIEAAHFLPKWLKPETSENRVFLYAGELHLIPLPSSPAEVTVYPAGVPALQTALDLVWGHHKTKASEGVQKAIQARIHGYPEKVCSLLHHAHCLLPLPAAHVLSCNPQLVAPAVHALCDRDGSDMKACRRMHAFGSQECRMARVCFSKYLYAMLTHENFTTPQHPTFSLPARSSSQFKAHELGMKLTCGLEILVSRGRQPTGEDMQAGSSEPTPVRQDPHWPAFLQSLEEKGFFRGEIDGSQLHRTLMSDAEAFFADMMHGRKEEGVGGSPLAPAAEIRRILGSMPREGEECRVTEDALEPPDDDSWLEVTPSQLDQLLSQYSSSGQASGSMGAEPVGGVEQLEAMVSSMKMFVGKVSSHEGAEFPWVADDSRAVDFDPQAVLDDVKRLLAVKEDGVSGEVDSSSDASGDEDSVASSLEGLEEDQEMVDVMAEMDRQLAHTEVGRSFAPPPVFVDLGESKEQGGEERDEEDLLPLDVDFNLMSNLLESYAAQCGEAGPSSNILHTMGIRLPPEEHLHCGSEGDSAGHTA